MSPMLFANAIMRASRSRCSTAATCSATSPTSTTSSRARCGCSTAGQYAIYNIGNHQPVALLDYIAAMERALGKKAKLALKPMQPGDVKSTYADTAALRDAVASRRRRRSTPARALRGVVSRNTTARDPVTGARAGDQRHAHRGHDPDHAGAARAGQGRPQAKLTFLGHPKRVEVVEHLPFVAETGAITKQRARGAAACSRAAGISPSFYGMDRPLVDYACASRRAWWRSARNKLRSTSGSIAWSSIPLSKACTQCIRFFCCPAPSASSPMDCACPIR
jgi:hypothetical protein